MIIETFLSNKLYNEYNDNVENNEYKDSFFDYCEDVYTQCRNPHYFIATVIISLITSIVAGILAWRCSAREQWFLRSLNTFVAVVFSDIYILYYLIYRVILKNKCY
jgi:hypothetical protein